MSELVLALWQVRLSFSAQESPEEPRGAQRSSESPEEPGGAQRRKSKELEAPEAQGRKSLKFKRNSNEK